jgi:hypothetical protein
MPHTSTDSEVRFGILDSYVVDSTKSFGLFIQLNGHTVFVDLREDKHLELRKARALQIFENQQRLGKSLIAFIEGNPEYRDRHVAYIGLHAKNMEQGEVFWDPEGYTLLRGFEFQPE